MRQITSFFYPFQHILDREESWRILDHAVKISYRDLFSKLRNHTFLEAYSNEFVDVGYNVFRHAQKYTPFAMTSNRVFRPGIEASMT